MVMLTGNEFYMGMNRTAERLRGYVSMQMVLSNSHRIMVVVPKLGEWRGSLPHIRTALNYPEMCPHVRSIGAYCVSLQIFSLNNPIRQARLLCIV
jgi:hypothetical protein